MGLFEIAPLFAVVFTALNLLLIVTIVGVRLRENRRLQRETSGAGPLDPPQTK
jgi:hypothetical protein